MGYIGQFPSASVLTGNQIPDNVITSAKIADGTVIAADIFDNTVSSAKMTTTGVAANTYGSTTAIPVVTVDAQGRLSNVTTASITAGATLENDVDTNFEYLVGMANAQTGAWVTAYVSNTKLFFNSNTGTLSASNFNNLSDEALKDNIVIISDATETINKIDGVEFVWKDSQKKSAGFIAQRIEEILPQLVATNQEGMKSVNYSAIIAYLVETVKELDQRVKALEAKG
jgi:hypothetical protein